MISLRSVPSWIEGIVGAPCSHARTTAAAGGAGAVKIWAVTPDGETHLLQIERQGRSPRRVVTAKRGDRGRAVSTGTVSRLRVALRAFCEGVEWLERLGESSDGDPNSPLTARHRALTMLLGRVGRQCVRPDPPSARTEIDAFLALAFGDWDVLEERPHADDPDWLRVVRAGFAGELQTIQEASGREPSPRDGALVIVAAVVFHELGFLDTARRWLEAGLPHVPPRERGSVYLHLADLARAAGESATAVRWLRAVVLSGREHEPERKRAAMGLMRCGAFDDAFAVLREANERDPDDADVVLELARLYLWMDRRQEAAKMIDRLAAPRVTEPVPANVKARLRGILAYRNGDLDASYEHFLAALEHDPDDVEAGAFLAEVLIRRGDTVTAAQRLERSRAKAETMAHRILAAAVEAAGPYHVEPPLEFGENPSEAERRAICLARLDEFAGNRGELLTRRVEGAGETGLVLVKARASSTAPRDQSAAALRRLVTEPVESVFAEMALLIERHPESPHPNCYRGELKLWLGDLDGAFADFEAGQRRRLARWAFVGMGAVHVLRGDLAAAEREFKACSDAGFGPIPGATTHVYRGEGLRRSGQLELARVELETALTVKRDRASAWMNLALTHLASGDLGSANPVIERVERRWPRLLRDAATAVRDQAAGPSGGGSVARTLEHALVMMRGNRSSHLITYFMPDGTMRVLQDASRWSERMRRNGFYVRTELRNRLVDAVFSSGDRA